MTLLLGVGVEIDLLDHSDRTALPLAARAGHEEVVKLLLAAGAGANRLDGNNFSPLHFSCIDGCVAAAKALIEAGACLEAHTAESGYTPLHLAINSGSLDLVRLLLQHGSDIKAQTAEGQTVLHLATALGNESLVKLMLDRGVETSRISSHSLFCPPLSRNFNLKTGSIHENIRRIRRPKGVMN
jgi:ankyrin repeat protein